MQPKWMQVLTETACLLWQRGEALSNPKRPRIPWDSSLRSNSDKKNKRNLAFRSHFVWKPTDEGNDFQIQVTLPLETSG